MKTLAIKLTVISFFFIPLLLTIKVTFAANNQAGLCKVFKNVTSPFGLIVDDKNGEQIKKIDLGEVNYKDFKHFAHKSFRLIVYPKRLLPRTNQGMMINDEFFKVSSKFNCKSTTEYIFKVKLEESRFQNGQFNLVYMINLEDPIADEPSDYVYTIKTKLTGKLIKQD